MVWRAGEMAPQRVHALVRCCVELKSVICLSDDEAHAWTIRAWASSSLKHLYRPSTQQNFLSHALAQTIHKTKALLKLTDLDILVWFVRNLNVAWPNDNTWDSCTI